ncbi:MAG: hypothetical protein H6631_10110 [Anaerolineaceae bacterium]|nr:hypothetical protein [Anaerolineaceae bacterium]MCB9098452.1 hypothetical protein [Anaerolineales bacterium]
MISPIDVFAAQPEPVLPIFVVMAPDSSAEKFNQVQTFIETQAGYATHIFPSQAVIAKVPADVIPSIKALPGVAQVFTEVINLDTVDIYGDKVRQLAEVWNSIIAPSDLTSVASQSVGDHFSEEAHTFTAPDLPPAGEVNLAGANSVTPGYYQTSEYMAGTVAVGIVLVESNGVTDPSSENWTTDEKQLVFNEIVSALNWWVELEPRAHLSFVYDDHFTNPLPTKVEPITRPYSDQQYWIKDAMTAIGYTSSSYFTQVRDYNNALRNTYNTNWAFTIFVVDSSTDSDNRFSDGYFAYAYLGGPFMVMTYGNNGYGPYYMDAVAAHEMGHIFQALDQYSGALQACDRKSGYLDVENQNSQYGNCAVNVGSIMRGQTSPYSAKLIDPYAAGQIGWRDSDNDNILDPLDTDLPIMIDNYSHIGSTIIVSGSASITPYPSPKGDSITINHLTGVKFRINDGEWQWATADDGQFNSPSEDYQATTSFNTPGQHTMYVAATDSAGNVSAVYATQSITILDPVDGGLNTELDLPAEVTRNYLANIRGRAYDMLGGTVKQVQYRVNDGSWKPAQPIDGAFDSSYEEFQIAIVNSSQLEPGAYTIEARAIDGVGYTEVNAASHQVQVKAAELTFFPLVNSGRIPD